MATAWGANTWGSGTWGGLDRLSGTAAAGFSGAISASRTTALTGVASSSFVGGLVDSNSRALTGAATSGAVGSLVDSVSSTLTGVVASGAVGSLVAPRSFSLSGVTSAGFAGTLTSSRSVSISASWGTNTWGLDAWGGVSKQAFGSVGVLGYVPQLTGVSASGNVGSVIPSRTVAITGNAASGTVGTTAVSNTVSLSSRWGINPWGYSTWGGGIVATGATGSVIYAPELKGVTATANVGTVTASYTRALTSVSATGDKGSLTVSSTANVNNTGLLITGSVWSFIPVISGVTAAGNVGNLTPSISVAIGGAWGSSSWGYNSWGSGLVITGSVNTPTYSPILSGASATADVGSVTASSTRALIGVASTGSAGSVTSSRSLQLITNSNWGSNAWGVGAWGINTFIFGNVGNVAFTQAFTGVSATGNVGTLAPSISVSIGGTWGLQPWGSGVWGGGLVIKGSIYNFNPVLNSVSAAGSVGTLTPSITLTLGGAWGVDTWGSKAWGGTTSTVVGSVGTINFAPELKSVTAAASVGIVTASYTCALTSVSAAADEGALTVSSTTSINNTGLLITGKVSGFSPVLGSVNASGSVGNLGNNSTVALTGVSSDAATGYLTAIKLYILQGVEAAGNVGVLGVTKSYWDIIDDAQNAAWTQLPNGQNANWGSVDAAQNADWTTVPNPQTPEWEKVDSAQGAQWQIVVDE